MARAGRSASVIARSPSVWWLRGIMSPGSMQSRWMMAWASAILPARASSRAARKLAAASGALRSSAFPSQTVASLSWMRSASTPPKTMAPSRPFPIGSASVHASAGVAYHMSGSVPVTVDMGSTLVRRAPTAMGATRARRSGSMTGSNDASSGWSPAAIHHVPERSNSHASPPSVGARPFVPTQPPAPPVSVTRRAMRFTPARRSVRGTAYERGAPKPFVAPMRVPLNQASSSSSMVPGSSTRSPEMSASESVISPTYQATPSTSAARPFPSQRPGTVVGWSCTPETARSAGADGAGGAGGAASAESTEASSAAISMRVFYRSGGGRFDTLGA